MASKNRTRSLTFAAIACVGGIGACSSSSGEPVSGSTAELTDNAQACPSWTEGLDKYAPGLSHPGSTFTFELTSASPPPPAPENMVWQLKVMDASGQPVTGATMTAPKTWMPQHMHASTAEPVVQDNNDGTFTVSNLYLYMPGVWQVTVNATSGTTTDSAVFTFCLGT
jgi:YtkA-like